jgi:hypothetical protein
LAKEATTHLPHGDLFPLLLVLLHEEAVAVGGVHDHPHEDRQQGEQEAAHHEPAGYSELRGLQVLSEPVVVRTKTMVTRSKENFTPSFLGGGGAAATWETLINGKQNIDTVDEGKFKEMGQNFENDNQIIATVD